MEDVVIEALGVAKAYQNVPAVKGVDFSVRRGECFGILGPNGAGKTSITKMLYNLVERDAGSLRVLGLDPLRNEIAVRTLTGIVPQEDNLDEDLRTRENLEVYARYFGMPREAANARIGELFRFFELEGKEKAPVQALSGGMKRRLLIARALLNDPQVLILDEPTIGLDPAARHHIWNKFHELQKRGIAILLTTHYMDEAWQICDRLMILDRGLKVLEGSPRGLMEKHFEKYVLETGCRNVIPDGRKVRCECHGGQQYVYADDENELFAIREVFGEEQVIIRNATLEDLFLKLTGRSLDD